MSLTARPPRDEAEAKALAAQDQQATAALKLKLAADRRAARERESAHRKSRPTPADVAKQSRAIAGCCDAFPPLEAARAAVVAELDEREAWLAAHEGRLARRVADWRSALRVAQTPVAHLDVSRRREGETEQAAREAQLVAAGLDPSVLAPIWPNGGTNVLDSEVLLSAALDVQRMALAGELFLAAYTFRQAVAMVRDRNIRPGLWLR